MPKSKPASSRIIQENIKALQSVNGKTISENQEIQEIQEIMKQDCSEGFSNLIQLYKNTEVSTAIRECAINTVFIHSQGVYGGLVKKIQLMLLEYCMKIFVKFSLSSITVFSTTSIHT